MRRLRQVCLFGHTQAFALDTVQALLQQREVVALAEQSQTTV